MKTRFLLLLGVLMAFWATGCVESQIDMGGDPVKITDINQSACKNALASGIETKDTATAPPLNLGTLSATVKDHNVTIRHNDAYYQCNAKIAFLLEGEGKALRLVEIDRSTDVAKCMCNMDLSVTLNNLTDGAYTLDVTNEKKDVVFGKLSFTIGSVAPQCTSNADCDKLNLTHDLCLGDWSCVSGQCQYACQSGCKSSADCPKGFECTFYGTPDKTTGSATDASARLCKSDSECAAGQTCVMTRCADGTRCLDGGGYCVTEEAGTCTPINTCNCPDLYAPVCGSDGKTYPNECEATCDGVKVAYSGACQSSECKSDSDCYAYEPLVDCTGAWACQAGKCLWNCSQVGCQSNKDCAAGYICELPMMEVNNPDVPVARMICQSDADCPAGIKCLIYDCGPTADCAGGGYCDMTPPVPNGVCVKDQPYCGNVGGKCFALTSSGVNCPSGWILYNLPYGSSPLCGDGAGCCVPASNDPTCRTDADCADYVDPARSSTLPIDYICVNGLCQVKPSCNCPEYYSPVCGSNGMTYDNDCFAKCDNTDIAYSGACKNACQAYDSAGNCLCGGFAGYTCPSDQTCLYYSDCDPTTGGADCLGTCQCAIGMPYCDPATSDTVCSSSPSGCSTCKCVPKSAACKINSDCPAGYACNTCPVDPNCPMCAACGPAICEAITVKCASDADCQAGSSCVDGACIALPGCNCPKNYSPACGSDGKTYDNECFAKCLGGGVAYSGACSCPPIGPILCDEKTEIAVCTASANGCKECKCQPNASYCTTDANCAANQYCQNGHCAAKPDCTRTYLWDPVCAFNGKTYANECEVRYAGLSVAYKGKCVPCTSDKDCMSGFSCIPFNSHPDTVCLPMTLVK